jgi:dinuclear metal center YbgI/SA1388 family protein
MIKINDIVDYLNQQAPPAYQESYDNAGLITGDINTLISGVLICLDSTEEVIDEAIEKKCNLIIAHHPIIFKGLNKISGKNYVERTIIKAIKNDISIFAIHTNLDNVHTGVNRKIGEMLNLKGMQILSPKKGMLSKLVVFSPCQSTANIQKALNHAGAGNIGNYKNCSFKVQGIGYFEPGEHSNPYIGSRSIIEEVKEDRIEFVFPSYLENKIMETLYKGSSL